MPEGLTEEELQSLREVGAILKDALQPLHHVQLSHEEILRVEALAASVSHASPLGESAEFVIENARKFEGYLRGNDTH